MADLSPTPTTIGVQAFTETSTDVTVHIVGDRAVVQFGDGRTGARLLGDATAVHLLIVEADRQLTRLRNGA